MGSTRYCSSAASNISNTAHDNASIKSLIDNEYQDVLFSECKYFTTYSLNNALRYRLGDVLIVHFNIRSLQKNIDKMSQYLSELEKQPEIIALTETKLKENYISGNIELPGYKFIHVNSSTLAGGVGFYIKEKIKFSVLEEFSIYVDAVENMWIRIETKKSL